MKNLISFPIASSSFWFFLWFFVFFVWFLNIIYPSWLSFLHLRLIIVLFQLPLLLLRVLVFDHSFPSYFFLFFHLSITLLRFGSSWLFVWFWILLIYPSWLSFLHLSVIIVFFQLTLLPLFLLLILIFDFITSLLVINYFCIFYYIFLI